MNITEESNLPLEILISTMNRKSLDFLDDMFRKTDISKYRLLIVNQTTPDVLLNSNNPSIKVLNSFDKGLSKSRNLALENARADIVLIADDDVIYESDFHNTILKAFEDCKEAAIISFKVLTEKKHEYRAYPKKSKWHTKQSLKDIMSIEIALNRKLISDKNIRFDTRFGLGGQFETAEEYIFCRDAFSKGLTAFFYNDTIVSHPETNSGQEAGADKIIYARAALHYKYYRQMAYLWLSKYIFFLLRHQYIPLSDVRYKWSKGLQGIKDYKMGSYNK